jgi:hypothetical protein
MGILMPWWIAPRRGGAVAVFVAKADYEEARQIVAEYEANLE